MLDEQPELSKGRTSRPKKTDQNSTLAGLFTTALLAGGFIERPAAATEPATCDVYQAKNVETSPVEKAQDRFEKESDGMKANLEIALSQLGEGSWEVVKVENNFFIGWMAKKRDETECRFALAISKDPNAVGYEIVNQNLTSALYSGLTDLTPEKLLTLLKQNPLYSNTLPCSQVEFTRRKEELENALKRIPGVSRVEENNGVRTKWYGKALLVEIFAKGKVHPTGVVIMDYSTGRYSLRKEHLEVQNGAGAGFIISEELIPSTDDVPQVVNYIQNHLSDFGLD